MTRKILFLATITFLLTHVVTHCKQIQRFEPSYLEIDIDMHMYYILVTQ